MYVCILGIILYVLLFQPLFLYLPFQAVHSGNLPSGKYLQAPTKYIKKFPHIQNTQRRTYAGKDHINKMKHRGISLHQYEKKNKYFLLLASTFISLCIFIKVLQSNHWFNIKRKKNLDIKKMQTYTVYAQVIHVSTFQGTGMFFHYRLLSAMVSALDDAVGSIVQSLKDKKMYSNSIIVFTTDNGGPANGFDGNAASNFPLRYSECMLW